jgi:hypothetical protein
MSKEFFSAIVMLRDAAMDPDCGQRTTNLMVQVLAENADFAMELILARAANWCEEQNYTDLGELKGYEADWVVSDNYFLDETIIISSPERCLLREIQLSGACGSLFAPAIDEVLNSQP